MQSLRSLLLLSAITALLGCENPADNKPVATVGSAKPTTTSTAMVSAKPSATAATTVVASTSASAAPAPVVVTIPAMSAEGVALDASSSVAFAGSKVSGKHEGKFEKFTGWAELVKGKIEGGKVAMQIDVASVKSDDEKLDGHLKTPDFFDVAKYPNATFESTEIKKGGEKGATHTITGNLDLHGVKKSLTFPAKVTESAKEVTAVAEFVINRKDFNIVYAGKADDLIRDEVVLKLTIKAPVKK